MKLTKEWIITQAYNEQLTIVLYFSTAELENAEFASSVENKREDLPILNKLKFVRNMDIAK